MLQFDSRYPLLVFGGPYSNIAATWQMQCEAQRLGIPEANIICTGDLVAYCAEPSETVNLIRDWGIHTVMGNCELSLAEDALDCGCGFAQGSACELLSVQWYQYAKPLVSDASKRWMGQLPTALEGEYAGLKFKVVHGAPGQINRFVFGSDDELFKRQCLLDNQVDLLLAGHCGIPFGQHFSEGAWLNAGVIGMPANDGTVDGWYMLLSADSTGVSASWHRLVYDAERAAERMRLAGLDNGYRQGLLTGLWPSLDVLPELERQQQGQRLTLAPLALG